jgi:hypothetical protein
MRRKRSSRRRRRRRKSGRVGGERGDGARASGDFDQSLGAVGRDDVVLDAQWLLVALADVAGLDASLTGGLGLVWWGWRSVRQYRLVVGLTVVME